MKNNRLNLDAFLSNKLDRKQARNFIGGETENEPLPIGPPKVTVSGPTGGLTINSNLQSQLFDVK